MTQDVVNPTLNPRTIRYAEAYYDIEDDANVIFRQARLARAMLESILSRAGGDFKRDLAALEDAVSSIQDAADRVETRYYAKDTEL